MTVNGGGASTFRGGLTVLTFDFVWGGGEKTCYIFGKKWTQGITYPTKFSQQLLIWSES